MARVAFHSAKTPKALKAKRPRTAVSACAHAASRTASHTGAHPSCNTSDMLHLLLSLSTCHPRTCRNKVQTALWSRSACAGSPSTQGLVVARTHAKHLLSCTEIPRIRTYVAASAMTWHTGHVYTDTHSNFRHVLQGFRDGTLSQSRFSARWWHYRHVQMSL